MVRSPKSSGGSAPFASCGTRSAKAYPPPGTRQARAARGETLLFFDGHCNPEPGAIARLVEDVEQTQGEAVITPKISALDAARWENAAQQSGHGYRLELEGFDCGWLPLAQLCRVKEEHRTFYESPAMIGCAWRWAGRFRGAVGF